MLIVECWSPFGNQSLLLDPGYYIWRSCCGGVNCVECIWWKFCTRMLCSRIKRGELLVFCISLIPVVVLWLVNSVVCCSLLVFGYFVGLLRLCCRRWEKHLYCVVDVVLKSQCLLPSSGEWSLQWWRPALSKGPNRVGVLLYSPSVHLRTEAEPASETVWFQFFNIFNISLVGRWIKSINPSPQSKYIEWLYRRV
jgi:hypothetical protein